MLIRLSFSWFVFLSLLIPISAQERIPALPESAELVLDEDWSSGRIDPKRWYVLRKKWGGGNHGVVPENVRIGQDIVDGMQQKVLICTAHGDQYQGPVIGLGGNSTRVGGVIVSQKYFASGRFEVRLKIGEREPIAGGPQDPRRPAGCIPAIWTYGYRYVEGRSKDKFSREVPLYNPHMPAYGIAANEYWSEIDFPEFGKGGKFDRAMYNTFLQNRHDNRFFDVSPAIDGQYHTFTTQWRTRLRELPDIRDDQVVAANGFWWIQDKAVSFDGYLGNPLKRLGKNRYALYEGSEATHWLDGRLVARNDKWVPAMAGQLNLGVWLPDWAGPADWKTADVKFASVKVWQFGDEGDVRGTLSGNLSNNFDEQGQALR